MAWRRTVGEFLRAMTDRKSFDPRHNLYMLFGLIWGLPIPVFSILLGFYLAKMPVSPACCSRR